MYGIYAYIGAVWGVNVGIYFIHGAFGYTGLQASQKVLPAWLPPLAHLRNGGG